MHVVIMSKSKIPAFKYGGVERAIWWLGQELVGRGHRVTYIVLPGSHCPFAAVKVLDETVPRHTLVPPDADFVHYQTTGDPETKQPYLVNVQVNNYDTQAVYDSNSVFVSANHAARYGATAYIHNGVHFDEYPRPDLTNQRKYVHFLANAAWKVKNVRGAIRIAAAAKEKLVVLGGYRFNFNMGIRLTFDTHVRFKGKVGTAEKGKYMNRSKGMLFPVLWDEPFGIAMIESLYYGCPVFGTPYGSLPEVVRPPFGFLSTSYSQLATAVANAESYSRADCHQYVVDCFSAKKMTNEYLALYEKVLNGEKLNAAPPRFLQPVPKYLPMQE